MNKKSFATRIAVTTAATVVGLLGFATVSAGAANAATVPTAAKTAVSKTVAKTSTAKAVRAKAVSKAAVASAYKKCMIDQSRAGAIAAGKAGKKTYVVPIKVAQACKAATATGTYNANAVGAALGVTTTTSVVTVNNATSAPVTVVAATNTSATPAATQTVVTQTVSQRPVSEILSDIAANRPTTQAEKSYAKSVDVYAYAKALADRDNMVWLQVRPKAYQEWKASHAYPTGTTTGGVTTLTPSELETYSALDAEFETWNDVNRTSLLAPYVN